MTEYVVKTSAKEADDILMGNKAFVFRGNGTPYRIGDKLMFRVISGQKPRMHGIEKQKYVVTYVSDEAPVEKGFAVIGFKAERRR